MDYSFIENHCANCAAPFSCASQIFPTITVVDETNCSKIQEIPILDAILFVYGFSATNLASAYLDEEAEEILPSRNKLSETGDYIMKSGLSLCNSCVAVFKEVYVAYHQLKKLSTQAAILSKAIKKFAPTYIKVEVDKEGSNNAIDESELGDTVNLTRRAANTVRLRKTPPEKVAVVATEEEATEDGASNELFDEFDVKEEYDDYENFQEDVHTDPLAETELTNVYVLVSSFDVPENKGDELVTEDLPNVSIQKSTVREGRSRPRIVPKKKSRRGRPRKATMSSSTLPSSSLASQYLKRKKPTVGQSHSLTQNEIAAARNKAEIPSENLAVNSNDAPKKCYSKNSLQATSSSTLPLTGLVSQNFSSKSSFAPGDDPGKTTKITKLPSEIVTFRKRDAYTKCYPNKSMRAANATVPNSATRIHLTRRTASLLSSIETNEHTHTNPEIVPETEQTEIPERRPTVKRILTEEQKEKARLNLKAAMKRRKYIGQRAHKRRQKKVQKKKLIKKPFESDSDDDLFNQYFENVTSDSDKSKCKTPAENNHQNESGNVTPSSVIMKSQEKEKILKCSCGVAYSSYACLRLHENDTPHEQDPLTCEICGETFMKNYLLYGHKILEHDELPQFLSKCNFCVAKFVCRNTFKNHMQQHHPPIPNSFICDKCGRSFNCLRYLRKHTMSIHEEEHLDKELFKCKECGIQLKHSDSLKKHIRLMHRSQKTFICEQCGKTTKNMTNMRIHMKVHDPNRIVKKKTPSVTTKTSDT